MTRKLLATALLTSCADLPEVSEIGAHVQVAAQPGLRLCAGTLDHMDDFVARVSEEFMYTPPVGDDRITFYFLGVGDFYRLSDCPAGGIACTYDRTVFSTLAPLNHEFVHSLAGQSLPFFEEGLAVAYGGLGDSRREDAARPQPLPGLDVRDLLTQRTNTELGSNGYEVAGAFTAYLIREHGISSYLDVYGRLGPKADVDGINLVFEDALGTSLEESIVEFDSLARDCRRPGFVTKLVECGAPELAWNRGEVVFHRELTCDQDDAIGPFGGDLVQALYTVTIPATGDYEIRVSGDYDDSFSGSYSASFQHCEACEQGLYLIAGAAPVVHRLVAGRYSVRLGAPAEQRGAIGLRLRRHLE